MKKVISLVLALALVLAVAIPAFATSTTLTDPSKLATGGTVKVDCETSVGKIKVVIPTAGKVIVNPYALKYTGTVNGKELTAETDQIIYPTQYISSVSTSKLEVYANITGTVAGNAKLVTALFDPDREIAAGTKVANNAFVVFQTVAASDGDVTGTFTAPTFAGIDENTDYDPNDTTKVVSNLVVSTKGTTTKVGELAALENAANEIDMNKAKNLAFRLTGVTEKNPDTPWTDKDKITASIVFTFVPKAETAATD